MSLAEDQNVIVVPFLVKKRLNAHFNHFHYTIIYPIDLIKTII